MNGINANHPPIQLQALTVDGKFQSIHQSGATSAAKEISSVSGINLETAQQKALTNGRLFEAGVSMMILDNPGKVGQVFDTFSEKLADVLDNILSDGGTHGELRVRHNGTDKTLNRVFKDLMVGPLTNPQSDQIGRKTEEGGRGEDWILDQLRAPLMTNAADPGYEQGRDFKSLLTKVKATCEFGTTILQLMRTNSDDRALNEAVLKDVLKPLGAHVADDFGARYDEFMAVTLTERFNDPVSRMRSERLPLVDGASIAVKYESAEVHNLGFGNVAVTAADANQQPALDQALGVQVTPEGGKLYLNINGAPRMGAPIDTAAGKTLPDRPFMMSRDEIDNLPAAYSDLLLDSGSGSRSFLEAVSAHEFEHGVGINRWQLWGTFAVESNLRGLPSAGSHSGGTALALLALNTLSDTRLYDQPDVVEPATLGIAAFMNFGGYHTFGETIVVGASMANGDDEFNPSSGTNFLVGGQLDRALERYPELKQGVEARFIEQGKGAQRENIIESLQADYFGPATTDVMHEDLYNRIYQMAHQHTGAQAFKGLVAINEAREKTHAQLCEAHPELKDLGKVSIQTTRAEAAPLHINRLA